MHWKHPNIGAELLRSFNLYDWPASLADLQFLHFRWDEGVGRKWPNLAKDLRFG